MMRNKIIGIIFFILLQAFSQAQIKRNEYKTKADSLVNSLYKIRDFSGSVVVIKNGELFYRNTSILSNGSNAKLFCIGSITKTFTAVAIAKLVDQNLLSFDDKLNTFIPQIANSDSISIRMLLNHSSGIKREIIDDLDANNQYYTSKQLIDSIAKYPLDNKPGKVYSYSNAAYAILARVIEIISGKSYSDFVKEHIFIPLNMDQSVVANNKSSKFIQGFDPSPFPKGIEKTYPENPSCHFGAGNIYCSIEDLTKWALTYSNGNKILKRETWDTILNKAYGFGNYQRAGKLATGHNGIVNGFTANMDYFKNDKVIILFLSNIRSGALNYLSELLAELYFKNKIAAKSLPSYNLTTNKNDINSEKFIGSYELFPGFNLDIKYSNHNFYLKGKGGYYTYLQEVSENMFFYRSLYSFITFKDLNSLPILEWKDFVSGSLYSAKKIK